MYAVVVGEFSGEQTERIKTAVQQGGAEPAFYWDAEDVKVALGDDSRPVPQCILIDHETIEAPELITWVRLRPRLFPVPVIALVPDVRESTFCALHAAGGDDAVLMHSAEAIVRRLNKLSEFDPTDRPLPDRGQAVVAHRDLVRRTVLGRILRIAGFDVAFAVDAAEVKKVAENSRTPTTLLVLHPSALESDEVSLESALREVRGDANTPTIVLSDEPLASLRKQLASLSGVLVEREGAPPDNLAFLANELLLEDFTNKRSSARLLHATVCGFRQAGSLESSFGVTYNLSAGGLYVRTLDAPPMGTSLWVELSPPGEVPVVHLRGEVMWGQQMSNRRASPPGFGLQFVPDSCPSGDLGRYLEAYHETLG